MSGLNAWKKNLSAASIKTPAKQMKQAVKRQMAWAAGTEYFQDRDPVYHVTESFCKTFDAIGSKKGGTGDNLFATVMQSVVPGLMDTADKPVASGADYAAANDDGAAGAQSRYIGQTDRGGLFAPASGKENERFLSRFSETTFSRGAMAGAVMKGKGQMMLFSCLKRTIGQSEPKNFRQRMLFESGASATRNVKGSPPDKVIFNRGAVNSAVGIVVDVLRDARRVVDTMTKLAEGGNMLTAGSGAETLQKMYPFLNDEKERALLVQYKSMLAQPGADEKDAQKRDVLHRAADKAQALIDKKAQMRVRFIHHLRSISDSATIALAAFEQPEFSEALYEQLVAYAAPPPPDDEENRREDERDKAE